MKRGTGETRNHDALHAFSPWRTGLKNPDRSKHLPLRCDSFPIRQANFRLSRVHTRPRIEDVCQQAARIRASGERWKGRT
ncbi:hypothetical protein NSU_1432 [Novosphingobium pentaromativorans US6-1]|uniref:Uncharacterized protein n=1 Tax=Novosphingobium pentaromativorans US6-1 TaxID=1088721 RepID=G6EAN4_9SPHN|nr:hypothetical protein NSU_1432 [Novosphingobium pentaromativorans US6-1]